MADNKTEKPMRRRDFLALAPACALSSGLFRLGPLAWAQAVQETQLVTVGYWTGASADESAPAGLVDAEDLSQGDLNFALLGARIDLHGPVPLEESKILQDCESLAVAVEFEPFHNLTFHPLTFSNIEAPNYSCAADFRVPIDEDAGLRIAIEYKGKNGSPLRDPIQFSLGDAGRGPKLRRGVYFLAFRAGQGGAFPNWEDYQAAAVEEPNGGAAVRLRPIGADNNADGVGFEYLVMAVDYGQQPAPDDAEPATVEGQTEDEA